MSCLHMIVFWWFDLEGKYLYTVDCLGLVLVGVGPWQTKWCLLGQWLSMAGYNSTVFCSQELRSRYGTQYYCKEKRRPYNEGSLRWHRGNDTKPHVSTSRTRSTIIDVQRKNGRMSCKTKTRNARHQDSLGKSSGKSSIAGLRRRDRLYLNNSCLDVLETASQSLWYLVSTA